MRENTKTYFVSVHFVKIWVTYERLFWIVTVFGASFDCRDYDSLDTRANIMIYGAPLVYYNMRKWKKRGGAVKGFGRKLGVGAFPKGGVSAGEYGTCIFGVIFLSEFGQLTPRVTLYSAITSCLAIYSAEIPSYCVPNIFVWLFCINKRAKLVSHLHITNIWGHLWSKCGYFTPQDDHI